MYALLRKRLRGTNLKGAKGTLAASGGMSASAMAACCAHYLVSLLPALSLPFLSAAAAGLARYQTVFFLVGVLYDFITLNSQISELNHADWRRAQER